MSKKILIPLIIILIAAATALYFQDKIADKTARQAVLEERKAWQQRNEELEEKITVLEKQTQVQVQQPGVDEGKLLEAFGEVPVYPQAEITPADKTAEKVLNLFRYLDQKGYLKANGIETPAADYFRMMVDRLRESRPVVSGETQNLYTLLKNITFLYRVLGKENLQVIKTILEQEDEIIEPAIKLLFEWIAPWNKFEAPGRIVVSDEALYDYAGFFIHTIAGQSYLFRRNSKTRSLVLYYCILILDRANENELNRYGIDVGSHVDALINDIQSHKQLAVRTEYLKKLQDIKKRYEG